MNNSIYLIGFMGSGKSTIGKEIAEATNFTWVDLDHYIEKEQDIKIKELFEHYGENYFRSLEANALKVLIPQKKLVVSTGGGVIVTPESVEILKKQRTVYLKLDFETLYQRVVHDLDRPLVKSYQQLLDLYTAREKLYESACSSILYGEGKSVQDITEEIISKMEEKDENSSY